MVNTEILEGLKQAMARGESLPRAMQSFTNAGYSQEEVDEASHYLQAGTIPIQQSVLSLAPTLQKFPPLPTQPVSQPPTPQVIQQVNVLPIQNSEQKKDIGTGWIILLIVLLVILLGALFGTIFFKDSLASFFNGLM